MYQLRALLEGYAARRAATRVDRRSSSRSCARAATASTRCVGGDDVRDARRGEPLLPRHDPRRPPASERLAGMVRQVIELPLVYKSYVWYSPDQASDLAPLPPPAREGARARATPSGPSSSCRSTSSRPATCSSQHMIDGHRRDRHRRSLSGGRRVSSGRETRTAGPLAGLRVIELGTLLAGPFTGPPARRLGRRDHQGRGAGQARPDPRVGQGALPGPLALVAGAVAQQEVHHAQPPRGARAGAAARARRARRRRDRELPPGHARALEPRPRAL